MFAASLYVDTAAQPDAVVPRDRHTAPEYPAVVNGRRLHRGKLGKKSAAMPGGGFVLMAPLRIAVGTQVMDNPGLVGLFEGARAQVWRNGATKRCEGFVDSISIDEGTGWATLSCKDGPEHANRSNHGVGTGKGWVVPPTSGDPEDPPVALGWAGANANIAEELFSWGPGVSVEWGDDHTNPWHFGYLAFVVAPDELLAVEMRAKLAQKASKRMIITAKARNLENPKKVTDIPVSIGDPPVGEESETITPPTVEGEAGGSKLVDYAGWSPMVGKGANSFVLRYKLTKKDGTDPTQPPPVKIPVGGRDTDFVAACYAAAFLQVGVPYIAFSVGGGLVFTEGMEIDEADTGTWAGHAGGFSDTVEARWHDDSAALEVGPINELGQVRHDIVVSNQPGARTALVQLQSDSKGQARRATGVASRADGATYRYTSDIAGTSGPLWDVIINVPTGAPVPEYIALVVAKAARPARTLSVALPPPSGGFTPGDWLDQGLMVGDSVMVVKDGPLAGLTTWRITGYELDPDHGDSLVLAIEAAS